jgi:hypothetical protein
MVLGYVQHQSRGGHLHEVLSGRSAAEPATKRMSDSVISTPQDANSMDDEDEQYSATGAA